MIMLEMLAIYLFIGLTIAVFLASIVKHEFKWQTKTAIVLAWPVIIVAIIFIMSGGNKDDKF